MVSMSMSVFSGLWVSGEAGWAGLSQSFCSERPELAAAPQSPYFCCVVPSCLCTLLLPLHLTQHVLVLSPGLPTFRKSLKGAAQHRGNAREGTGELDWVAGGAVITAHGQSKPDCEATWEDVGVACTLEEGRVSVNAAARGFQTTEFEFLPCLFLVG